MNVQKPQKIENILLEKDFNSLKFLLNEEKVKSSEFQEGFSRYIISDSQEAKLKEIAESLIPVARYVFKSKSLLPTYTLFAHYEGPNAQLWRHKDDNACTYTLDMCLYQKYAWDLWVENQPYNLLPNEALAYYGNDQEYWRELFPMKDTNYVGMIFFHFAEPDHWFFTKGRTYLDVIRGNLTEEEWQSKLIL
jgi:hypothetical protein